MGRGEREMEALANIKERLEKVREKNRRMER